MPKPMRNKMGSSFFFSKSWTTLFLKLVLFQLKGGPPRQEHSWMTRYFAEPRNTLNVYNINIYDPLKSSREPSCQGFIRHPKFNVRYSYWLPCPSSKQRRTSSIVHPHCPLGQRNLKSRCVLMKFPGFELQFVKINKIYHNRNEWPSTETPLIRTYTINHVYFTKDLVNMVKLQSNRQLRFALQKSITATKIEDTRISQVNSLCLSGLQVFGPTE